MAKEENIQANIYQNGEKKKKKLALPTLLPLGSSLCPGNLLVERIWLRHNLSAPGGRTAWTRSTC